MRIAVNTRFLLKNKLEGFGWYTHEVVSRMVKNNPEHEFIFLFDRPFDEKFVYANNVTPVVLYPPARHPILFRIWFNWSVKRALKKYKADVFFSPDGYMSLTSQVKQVGVIHDLNFEHHPEDLPKSARIYLKKYFPLFAKKAKHILTVSNYSKQDIVSTYGVSGDKITVAYNGIGDFFFPISESKKDDVRRKFTQGNEYFIFVGALHPRKNVVRLFNAFDQFKRENKNNIQLLIVGEKYWWNEEIQHTFEALTHKQDIVFTGHVQSTELNDLYGAALALTFVSYFEGFGIPLVEAMKCEIPIIASNATCLPEVAGEAAIYIDPYSVDEIANAMNAIATNPILRLQLVHKGKERCKAFSWDITSQKAWETIEKVYKS